MCFSYWNFLLSSYYYHQHSPLLHYPTVYITRPPPSFLLPYHYGSAVTIHIRVGRLKWKNWKHAARRKSFRTERRERWDRGERTEMAKNGREEVSPKIVKPTRQCAVKRWVNIFYLLVRGATRGYILPRCGLLYTAYRYLCVAALPKHLIYELWRDGEMI